MLTVCSFYVDRRADHPKAVDYLPLLHALDRSCWKLGLTHVVLTDRATAPQLCDERLVPSASDLPRDVAQATTEAQACWLEGAPGTPQDTLFVGADCLIRRDFRGHLPDADLSIILRPGHKRHRINNGFMFIPAGSREKVAALFRRIADSTKEEPSWACADMVAVEKALSPMPLEYGIQERAGLTVNFLPMHIWNAGPKVIDDRCDDAFVLHFRGRARKGLMVDWARVHLA